MRIEFGYIPSSCQLTIHCVGLAKSLGLEVDDWVDVVDYLEVDESLEASNYNITCHELWMETIWACEVLFFENEFLAMTVQNVLAPEHCWNLWLSFFLPDEVVAEIHAFVHQALRLDRWIYSTQHRFGLRPVYIGWLSTDTPSPIAERELDGGELDRG